MTFSAKSLAERFRLVHQRYAGSSHPELSLCNSSRQVRVPVSPAPEPILEYSHTVVAKLDVRRVEQIEVVKPLGFFVR